MNCKILIIFLSLVSFPSLLSADTPLSIPLSINVTCSYHQLCNLAQHIYDEIADDMVPRLHLDSLVPETIDPHDYSPTADVVKKLLNAKILLLPWEELQPWTKKILVERNKDADKKTFVVPRLKNLPQHHSASHAHFWLFPELLCHTKKTLHHFLSQSLAVSKTDVDCHKSTSKITQMKIKTGLASLGSNTTLILTHDALLPYFESLHIKGLKIYALKGSHHHDEISPKIIKEVHQAIQEASLISNGNIVWLYEEEIPVPMNIRKLVQKNHKVVHIQINGKLGENPLQVMKNLGRAFFDLKVPTP